MRLLHSGLEDVSGGEQFAYLVDPMPGPYCPFTNDGQSGLVSLVELRGGTLLAIISAWGNC
ncbi:MAG: hypothetical protein QGH76_06855 [Phycisphaerales bacterium]|nr:hypothetical protein [Phycisphaerales bacterium]